MRYRSFRIQNFKGIKDTTIVLEGLVGANVFAFVGLNESGKTTVLEAIHSFAPDKATGDLLGGETGVPFKKRVPRHLISEFSGRSSVTATLAVTAADRAGIRDALRKRDVDALVSEIGDELVFERYQIFEKGDLKGAYFALRNKLMVKTGNQRKWREPTADERVVIRDTVFSFAPSIAYFPTFIFDFPPEIYLTDRGNAIDTFYRSVFQDILDSDGRGHSVENDIVRRVRSEKLVRPWLQFLTSWSAHDDREKIQHIMDRASAAVTRLVFERWNKIFGEDTRGKEVVISYDVVEGEKRDANNQPVKTQEHDVLIKFQIRDGTRRFAVNDRSLGFRWFFSFMLFTQFRAARSTEGLPPILFLFDEPAANLHAAAQQKLIESFPAIAKGEHVLAYSTHSHYMIEPKWLEQTFIVTNRADAPPSSVLDEISLDDDSLDIQVATYRSFVSKHPGKTSYFQPILDRLEVVPSKFDAQKSSVVLEGKSDYYVLRYAQRLFGENGLHLLPGLGAGTFGALAALHVGWNLNFLFVLDGDHQGKVEKKKYSEDFGIPLQRLVTLDEIDASVRVIEDLLGDEAKLAIQAAIGTSKAPSKPQIRRFFQERLASDHVESLGLAFDSRAKAVLEELQKRIGLN